MNGEDFDQDGYFSDVDCNDKNANVFPGAIEIPYDGIDQDCSGEDLTDFDSDGFDSIIVGGLDCNDLDYIINPNNPDLSNNCVNDAPIIFSISLENTREDATLRITVDAYDPEGDLLVYFINDSRFSKSGTYSNTFTWGTTYEDAGEYFFTANVSDSEFTTIEDFAIIILNKNRIPTSLTIPEISWAEDLSYILNLSEYFYDLDGDSLLFGIENTSEETNIFVDSLSENNELMLFNSTTDWNGEDWIEFFAYDGKSKKISNRVNLNVSSVNDAPVLIQNIPDIFLDEDTNLLNYLDLFDYFVDIDSNLSFSVSENEFINITISNGFVSFVPARDFSGNVIVTFTAEDEGYVVSSNALTINVAERGEPPVFTPLDCQTELEEDSVYQCILNATDIENNSFEFIVYGESSLNCTISENILTYSPYRDYFGAASCEFIIRDIDGFDLTTLYVNVSSVNDAPLVESFSPLENVRLLLGRNQSFSIDGYDPDLEPLSFSWVLNGNMVSSSQEYIFSSQEHGEGVFNLTAFVLDSELNDSHSWNVFVGDTTQFTCAEVSGHQCSSIEFCPSNGENLTVSDSSSCCSVQCQKIPPSFDDADKCEFKNSSLAIDIISPEESDELTVGDELDIEITLENNGGEDQSFKVKAYLYDLDDNKVVEETSVRLDVNEDEEETTILGSIEIPSDLDLGHSYALYAKAEDDLCNDAYTLLSIERQEHKLDISDISLSGNAVCGSPIKIKATVENVGSSDEETTLQFLNPSLKLSYTTPYFDIEKSGENDKESKEYTFTLPTNAQKGDYQISVTASYRSGRVSETKTLSLEICDTELSNGNSSESNEQEQSALGDFDEQLTLNSPTEKSHESAPSLGLAPLIGIFLILLVVLASISYLLLVMFKD